MGFQSSGLGGGWQYDAWSGRSLVTYKGYTIEPMVFVDVSGMPTKTGWRVFGQVFPDIGSAELAVDKQVRSQPSEKPPEPGPKPEPPSEPSGDKGGGKGGGGDWDWDWERRGGGDWSGGGSGTPGGAGTAEQTSTAQPSEPAQPAVPDWMQKRMEYWDEKQKQLLEAATAAYHYSGQKYEEAWKQVGEKSREAAMDLAKKYGQGLGILAQGESQQQSALARYAATGRMSGGAAEQAMTSAARETAKGAMGEYQSYAGARAGLADSAMRAYTALGQEASTYTKMVLDAMQSMPNPYRDWANFMAGLSGFSAVAVS